MKKCEVLLGERSKLKDATSGKKIMERKKIENTINSLLEDIRLDIKEMEKELKHQRKYPQKFPEDETKRENLNLLVKKKKSLSQNMKMQNIMKMNIVKMKRKSKHWNNF